MRTPPLHNRGTVWFLACALAAGSPACAKRNADGSAPPVAFVRGGIIVPGPAPGRALPDGRVFAPRTWAPGEATRMPNGTTVQAPAQPELVAWWRRDLGGVGADSAGGGLPDTALAFAPDGQTLAIATSRGELLALATETGRVRWRVRAPAGYYKTLTYTVDGHRLVAGEQSAAATLTAFDAATGAIAWQQPLADALGPRDAPTVTGRWSRYGAPGVVKLAALPGGRVAAAVTQSWSTPDGWARYGRIVAVSADGTVAWQFPRQRALRQSIVALVRDAAAGNTLAFAANGTADAQAPLPTTGIGVLDAATGAWRGGHAFGPQQVRFGEAYIWEGLAVAHDGSAVTVGLTDGRVATFALPPTDEWTPAVLNLGTPASVGGLAVVSSASYALATPRRTYVQTNDTRAGPWGVGPTTQRAPAPHPNAGTVWTLDANGRPAGRYRGPFTCNNFAASADGTVLASLTTPPLEAHPHTRHGLVLLDGNSPTPRPIAHYPLAGPAFFRTAVSPDGFFVAVVECPAYDGTTHTQYGTYQIHLVH